MPLCLPARNRFLRSPPSPRQRSRRRGVGLIDCLMSIVVISLSTFGYLAASMSSTRLEVETRAVAVAVELTRDVLEELQATPLAELVARYNDDPADDPGGAGTSRGASFVLDTRRSVEETHGRNGPKHGGGKHLGLDNAKVDGAKDAIPGQMKCEVRIPTWKDGGGVAQLTENSDLPEFGLPADLNGDGTIDGTNRIAQFHVLPVVIRMEWPKSDGSTRSLDFATVLGGRVGK